jgi:hypothetical protein
MVEGILWVLRTGAPWADLPGRYPPYQTCQRWFQTGCEDRTLKRLLVELAKDLRERGGIDEVEGSIDGSYVGAPKGGLCVGKCRAGNATKVMALADSAGLPLAVSIADGSRHDVTLVDRPLDEAVT